MLTQDYIGQLCRGKLTPDGLAELVCCEQSVLEHKKLRRGGQRKKQLSRNQEIANISRSDWKYHIRPIKPNSKSVLVLDPPP